MRCLRPLLLVPLLAALAGCAVYPAGPAYYPPAASVYVAPRPYHAPRPYGYGYGGYGYRPYGYGYRRW
ncbi:MAG: hypothetical protein ACOYOH_16935 [Paracraurococcus sp.]